MVTEREGMGGPVKKVKGIQSAMLWEVCTVTDDTRISGVIHCKV